LEFGAVAGRRTTRVMGAIEPAKKFDDIFSRVDTMYQRDRQTDTARQLRMRLRIASRSNKMIIVDIILKTNVRRQRHATDTNTVLNAQVEIHLH